MSEHRKPDHLADLVSRFSEALLEKLRAAEQKYGRRDDWLDPNWEFGCQSQLLEHLAKGDPRDVAAYCAFMWHHGWKTRTFTPAQSVGMREALEKALWELTDLARPICSVFNRSTKKYEYEDEHIAKALPGTFEVIQQIRASLSLTRPKDK